MFIRRYLGTGRWELELVSYIMLWFYSLWVFFPEAPNGLIQVVGWNEESVEC